MTLKHYTSLGGKFDNLTFLNSKKIHIPPFVGISSKEDISKEHVATIIQGLSFPLIVRSSANIEDSTELSFAGQFDSHANISSVDKLCTVIKKLSKSFPSEKILRYTEHYNVDVDSINVSYIIQEYKKPIFSGVLFTELNEDQNLLKIEYSRNSSHVTDGTSRVQSVLFNKSTKKIEGGSEEKWIKELVKVGLHIEKLEKAPQDIEWVCDRGKIWIVQSRPITTQKLNRKYIIKRNTEALKQKFGDRSPSLGTREFLDGITYITPLSLSFLHHIYSPHGPWGTILKRYFTNVPDFDPDQYILSIFARPYVNNDLESKLLAKQGIRAYLGTLRAHIEMFYWYSKRSLSKESSTATIDTLEGALANLSSKSTPLLFRVALYQSECVKYFKRKLKKYITDDEWFRVITPIIEASPDKIPVDYSHNAHQEFELSTPRFGENDAELENVVPDVNISISSKNALEIRKFRLQIIDRIQSKWEQQELSLYFSMYDYFSTEREVLHGVWLKDIYNLRMALLKKDQEMFLYNTIWYTNIQTVLKKSKNLSRSKLLASQREFEVLKSVPISNTIENILWKDILAQKPKGLDTDILKGTTLSPGYASGQSGVLEDLTGGKKIDILLTDALNPSLTIFFDQIKGIVCERGGQLSHAAIIAREYNIPILQIDGAVSDIPASSKILLDTSTNSAQILP